MLDRLKQMRVRHMLAGALLFGGIASAQSIEDDRTALARAKAQSILADQRAAELEAKADAEMGEAEAAKGRAAAIAARIQSAEADISAAETRIRLIEKLQIEQDARLAAKHWAGAPLPSRWFSPDRLMTWSMYARCWPLWCRSCASAPPIYAKRLMPANRCAAMPNAQWQLWPKANSVSHRSAQPLSIWRRNTAQNMKSFRAAPWSSKTGPWPWAKRPATLPI
jgi:hypothetical protein